MFIVKLADVEFASRGRTPEHMRGGGTPNWTAPEVLDGSEEVSPASDVYALGNVLFEIAASEVPFGHELDPRRVAQCIKEGQRPLFPEGTASLRYQNLVSQAWAQDPEERPSAAEVAAYLMADYRQGAAT